MQITKLRLFDTQNRQDLIEEGATVVDTYYIRNKIWHGMGGEEITGTLKENLQKALKLGAPLRPTNSKITFYPVPEVEAVVCATFQRALKEQSQKQMARVVARSFKDASNAFEVEYNQLTGLLGKKQINLWLKNELSLSKSLKSIADEESVDQRPAQPAVAVISIDIDFFKQVNDNYGHAYGDVVLRAFAMRLNTTTQDFSKNNFGIKAVACHASGEEFFVLAAGDVESDVFSKLAEAIRRETEIRSLPDKSQLTVLMRDVPADSVTIPEEKARNITCSIGLIVTGNGSATGVMPENLLKQADAALYRAKALGRNQVVGFDTILANCGRVLEHRQDVGVIVIDIGKDVGVVKGQEFKVFHPDFSGTTPFYFDDGRTKRILGRYPKIPLAGITVIEAQAQISFCRHSEEGVSTILPSGSMLEAVPLGSISHLFTGLSSSKTFGVAEWMRPETESKVFFERQGTPESGSEVAVLKIANQTDLLERRGADFVNHSLAAVAEAMRRACMSTTFAGIIAGTELSIVTNAKHSLDLEALLKELDTTSSALGRLPIFHVGVFKPLTIKGKEKWSPPSYEGQLELARYASTYPGKPESNFIEVFSESTVIRGLEVARVARAPSKGLADFERFKLLGFTTAKTINWAGLLKNQAGDKIAALELYVEASALEPTNRVYRLNCFVMRAALGDDEGAVNTILASDKEKLLEDPTSHIGAAAGFVGLLVRQIEKNPTMEDLALTQTWIEKVSSVANETAAAHRWHSRWLEVKKKLMG
jgi:diguanylate cyclase (GGDEF)-like protein